MGSGLAKSKVKQTRESSGKAQAPAASQASPSRKSSACTTSTKQTTVTVLSKEKSASCLKLPKTDEEVVIPLRVEATQSESDAAVPKSSLDTPEPLFIKVFNQNIQNISRKTSASNATLLSADCISSGLNEDTGQIPIVGTEDQENICGDDTDKGGRLFRGDLPVKSNAQMCLDNELGLHKVGVCKLALTCHFVIVIFNNIVPAIAPPPYIRTMYV